MNSSNRALGQDAWLRHPWLRTCGPFTDLPVFQSPRRPDGGDGSTSLLCSGCEVSMSCSVPGTQHSASAW